MHIQSLIEIPPAKVNLQRGAIWGQRKIRRLVRPLITDKNVKILSGIAAGLRLYASKHDHGYDLGTSELPVQKALREYLRGGDIFYDIGANIGFFSIIGALLVLPEGHVYAFEPVPQNALRIQMNAQLNDFHHVSVIEKAVADSSRDGELILADHPAGAVLASAGAPPDATHAIAIQLVAIDDLVMKNKLQPPTVVKIDVEGAEIEVLLGMSATIKKFSPVIIYEIDDGEIQKFEEKNRRCEEFLTARGYKIQLLEESYPGAKWRVSHTVATPA